MKMSLNDLSMARSGYLYIPEFLCGFFKQVDIWMYLSFSVAFFNRQQA